MKPPGNSTAPPSGLNTLTLRTTALDGSYAFIDPAQFRPDQSSSSSTKSKVALVTGSGRGIGKSIAGAFAEGGYDVVVTARNEKEVQATTQELKEQFPGVKVVGVAADATKLGDLERLVRTVNEELGEIDVLVCNAGTNTFMPFTMTEAEDWWYSLEINLKAPTELTRLVLPQMRKRNSGTIIYTSSRAAVLDLPWTTAYGCGKTALTRFAACLQAELDQTQLIDHSFPSNGISLFSIHPGEVETNLHDTAFPPKTHAEAPYIVEFMAGLAKKHPKYDASLAAWTCVALARGKAEKLRGRYVDCTRDLGEQIALVS